VKGLKWRAILTLAILAVAVVLLIPTLAGQLPSWWSGALPSDKIHLGLDLQGGMHMVLEVEAQKAVESNLTRSVQGLKDEMRSAGIRYGRLERVNDHITLQLASAEDRGAIEKLVKEEFPNLNVSSATTEGGGLVFDLVMPSDEQARIRKLAVEQALETIGNRIDQFGVVEPDIRQQGENELVLQLPGIKDTQRAVKLIGQTALLEFKLVDDNANIDAALKGNVPPDSEVLYENRMDRETGRMANIPLVVKKATLMTGEFITDARVQIDSQFNEPYVSVSFDSRGARLFGKITTEHTKQRLAIVLDNTVYSAPVIQEPITGGDASITGNFTTEEASDLAIVLRAGALPAPVKIIEERTVGPSLGADSVNMGVLAALVGGGLVVLFMLVYYKTSGLVANVALILNVILILAGLAALQATLTLPGIAGIVLTIGMAVDSNVLILERVREELRLGKTMRAAIDSGYSRAIITIFDCNLTTIATALILYHFGTGPIRGFGVTLALGIAASFFTAIFVTRMIYDYLLVERRVSQISV